MGLGGQFDDKLSPTSHVQRCGKVDSNRAQGDQTNYRRDQQSYHTKGGRGTGANLEREDREPITNQANAKHLFRMSTTTV